MIKTNDEEMKNQVFLFLAMVLIIIILASQISLTIAINGSYSAISSSGTIRDLIGMRKHVIVYVGWLNDEDREFVSSHFNLVVTTWDARGSIDDVKASNPNIVVLMYRDIMGISPEDKDWYLVDPHEDWFLHDINGNRIQNKQYGWYALDVGNSGWRTYYANWVKNKISTSTVFDGVFADDVLSTFWYDLWTVPESSIPLEIGERWYNDMAGMVQYVKSTIENKLLILNTDEWIGEYLQYSDGIMLEGFVHKSNWELDYFGPRSFDPLSHVDILSNLGRTGKYFLAHSGAAIPDNPTQLDLDRAHNMAVYCFSSFLLGIEGDKTTFGFNRINSKDNSRGYYPEFDVALGSPTGKYYLLGKVYSRDFAKGKVLVNFMSSSYNVTLGKEYITLDGQKISYLLLGAHSGAILLNP